MTGPDDTPAPGPVPDDARLSALSKALVRISASLDLETVLQEVADGACELTGARYGCIVTVDESGTPGDFVTSGLTEDDHRRVAAWPGGLRLFEQLRDLPGPFRIADFAAFVRSLGVTWDVVLASACMSTPLRHLGAHVGNFFLGDKQGGAEFTDEDEEVLLLFAAQAAAAIVNARTYRAEQRARADLETLVETSPVGVVVFDARTGRPASFNREARRMFEVLRVPDHPREHVLEVATCRFADGREIELDRFPLVETMKRAETLRAEEMVVSTPGGGSIRVLLNATPIHAEDGTVRSLVATAQDLAPLEALDRMRADFLGMVSHELRTPLAAIKGSTTTVLGPAQSFGPAETRQFFRIIDEQADRMSALIGDLLDAGRIDAGTLSVAPEPSEPGRAGRAGADRVPLRRRPAHGAHRPAGGPSPRDDRPGAHRAGAEQPARQRGAALPGDRADPCLGGARRHARRGHGRGRGPGHRAGAPAAPVPEVLRAGDGERASGPGWGSPSARGWSRRMAGASGPRAPGRARAPASPSRSRWPGGRPAAPASRTSGAHRRRGTGRSRVSWWWTTTRRCCATCATRCSGRAMPRWLPPTSGSCPDCSKPRSPPWSCST